MADEICQGAVLSIERCSLYDGPGLRTGVFLMGCPLRCAWCHNPETQRAESRLGFFAEKCTMCGNCIRVCPRGVHKAENGTHTVERSLCRACRLCAGVCNAGALRVFGDILSVEDVLRVVRADVRYFEQTGGGVTVSGGEPYSQPEFLSALLRACHAEGIHTCVETSGYAPVDRLAETLGLVDLFLFDYKHADPAAHRTYTGADNRRILQNLRFLIERKQSVILRCPIIPGVNDSIEHFHGIARLENQYPELMGVEIMPYHDMGRSKAAAVGQAYTLRADTAADSLKEDWKRLMRVAGCSERVIASF